MLSVVMASKSNPPFVADALYSASEIKQIEQQFVKAAGIELYRLMEEAGAQAWY
jgi:NAD(P)H-hydrate repair Nnr-like enzyme with NAD(P)H-hydrate epimerase domain